MRSIHKDEASRKTLVILKQGMRDMNCLAETCYAVL